MRIIQSLMNNNPCYAANRKITVKGLMLHSVGCPQPSAKAFINSWNSASYDRACVHAFIESNGDVYQTLPWNHRGWHCGGSGNDTHIGVEMCEPVDSNNREYVLGAYNTAVELFAKLCKEYKLDPTAAGVIVSHKEGHAKGIASNHGDPEHIWCRHGLTMDKFRKDVGEAMRMKVSKEKIEVKGKDIELETIVVKTEKGDKTFVEMRAYSEILGHKVKWDNKNSKKIVS